MSGRNRPSVKGMEVAGATEDGVAILTDGRFATVDDRFAELHGYEDADALAGSEWRSLFPCEERDRVETDVLPKARVDGEWRGQVTTRRADGQIVRHEATVRETESGALVWAIRDARKRGTSEEGAGSDEAQYRRLFDAAPVPIGVVTADRGIVYCNRAAVEFLGADGREDVVGRSPGTFVHPDDRERVRGRLGRVLEERESTTPLKERLVALDGEDRMAIVASAPATYEDEPAAQIVMNDVTEHQRTRARLRREQRFVRTVIDSLDDVLYVLDEDGEAYLWNEMLAETTGYTHGEIDAMHAKKFLPESQHEYAPGLIEAINAIDDRRVELDILTKDGESIPHEFRGTTFEDPVSGETYRCGLARDISERLERERELERYETIVETVDDGVYAVDDERSFTLVNHGLCEMLGETREELLGADPTGLFAQDDEVRRAPDVRSRIVGGDDEGGTIRATVEDGDGERTLESRYRLHPEPEDGEFAGRVGVVRDVTERIERERQLERQRDELSTLDRINELLFEVVDELVETTTRDAVEEIVCERLAESDLYGFAWTGDREIGADGIVPRTCAGDDGYLASIADPEEGSVNGGGPIGRAMETGEVRTVNADSSDLEPWHEEAFESRFESLIAVPLRNRETVYGVLVVYATRSDAFSVREQDGFAVLGRAVGHAIDAIQRRRLLFADAVTELEFRVTDDETFLARDSREYGCRFEIAGHVSAGDRWILYVDVDGMAAGRISEVAAADPTVVRARPVDHEEETGRVELVLSEASFLHRTVPTGARVRTIAFEDGVGRLTLESPSETDVREVVEQFDATFDSVELLARRELDRSPEAPPNPTEAIAALTDRQREALEVAYRAGYFEWPRQSSSEEVADALDLAGSTFLGHVRKAEKALVSRLFD